MSDTPIGEDRPGGGPTLEFGFDPVEGDEQLGLSEVVDILLARFQAPAPPVQGGTSVEGRQVEQRQADDQRAQVLLRMADLIPPEYRTAAVISQVDLRPLLFRIAATPEQAMKQPEWTNVGGADFDRRSRIAAQQMLDEEQLRIKQDVDDLIANGALQGVEEITDPAAWRAKVLNDYKYSNELTLTAAGSAQPLTREVDADSGQILATDTVAQRAINSFYGITAASEADYLAAPDNFPYRTQSDVDLLFQMDIIPWMDIITEEGRRAQAGMTPFQIDVGAGVLPTDPEVGRVETPGEAMLRRNERPTAPITPVPGRRNLRLLEAYNKINDPNMNPKWIENMQNKLMMAGYIDEDADIYWGDSTDRYTLEGWRQLVADSGRTKRSMADILAERTRIRDEQRAEEEETPVNDIVLTSRATVRATADRLGIDLIGRTLKPEDHARLVRFIQDMERTQQTTLDQEGSQEVERVNVEDEIAQWIEQEKPVETVSNELLGQFQAFNELVRRPG